MNKYLSLFLTLCLLLTLVGGLAACGSQQPTENTTVAAGNEGLPAQNEPANAPVSTAGNGGQNGDNEPADDGPGHLVSPEDSQPGESSGPHDPGANNGNENNGSAISANDEPAVSETPIQPGQYPGLELSQLPQLPPPSEDELFGAGYDQALMRLEARSLTLSHSVFGQLPEENYLDSPFSLESCMLLYAAGQGGQARQAIAELLYPGSKSPLELLKQNIADLQLFNYGMRTRKSGLQSANLVLRAKGLEWSPAYLEDAARMYAGVGSFDMQKDGAKRITDSLNKWISDHTLAMIPSAFNEPLSPNTVAVLLNCLAFDGQWSNQFDRQNTKDLPFHRTDGSVVKVPTMQMKRADLGSYFEDDKVQVLRLPYRSSASMMLILPKKGVKASAALEHFQKIYPKAEFQSASGEVKLPRFHLQLRQELLGRLMKDPKWQPILKGVLAGPSQFFKDGDPLLVSQMFQEAVLDLNEDGTKAAAVTAMALEKMSMMPGKEVQLSFDRPFAFALMSGGVTLFRGLVFDPVVK